MDYKQTITHNAKDKKELTRDISSFANEIGGTPVYGVPEKKAADGSPIPKKPYGMPSTSGMVERMENILRTLRATNHNTTGSIR